MRVISARVVLGLAILAMGVLLLLRMAGVPVNPRMIFATYWPVIPLILGLNWLILSFRPAGSGEGRRVFFSWGQLISAVIALAVGVIYLGRNLGYFEVQMVSFWRIFGAFVLILIGLSLLKGFSRAGQGRGRVAFMGGIGAGGSTPWKLESGSYLAFMGGIDLDLTTAEIPPGETVLDLTAFMGGIDVKIPPDLAVIYQGSSVLGGVTFRGHEDAGIVAGRTIEHNVTASTERLVRIQARAIMGGIEIKEKP
jgi:hypothetical protein